MINRAEKDSSYVREGTITGTFYNSDCGKWYFTYVIPTDGGYGDLEGYSYSIYDANEIKNFVPGETLEFAVGFTPVTLSTDSIDMGYKNKPLSDDGEYISIVKERRNLRAFGILSCVASAGFLTAGAVLLFKNLRKKKPQAKRRNAKRNSDSPLRILRQRSFGRRNEMPELRRKRKKTIIRTALRNCFPIPQGGVLFSVIYFEGISDIYGDGSDG